MVFFGVLGVFWSFLGFEGILVIFWVSGVSWPFLGFGGILVIFWVLGVIGEQKNESNSCSSKESSRANRAVWTKNHPRRDNVHGQ